MSKPNRTSFSKPLKGSDMGDTVKFLNYDSKDTAHLEKWRRYMISETNKQYGRLSTIFINDKYPPKPSLPSQPDAPWNDRNDPGGIEREALKQAVQNKFKTELKWDEDKPKLFGYMLQCLSQSSLMVVQRRAFEMSLLKLKHRKLRPRVTKAANPKTSKSHLMKKTLQTMILKLPTPLAHSGTNFYPRQIL